MSIAEERSYPTPYANSPLLPLLLFSLSLQKHSPKTSKTFKDEYDYIIVGAGSAGSVVASRLSEYPDLSVLLLEAGKPPPKLTDIPAIARYFLNTDIDWKFNTTAQKHTAKGLVDQKVPWPSGKALGGSSILNAMLYVRGNRENYQQWAEQGAKGWSYDDVLPYFKKLEDNMDFAESEYHGVGGPITASRPRYQPKKKRVVKKAIENLGYSFGDPNGKTQNGFYDQQGSIRKGQRCSTAKAYLVPAEKRPNLTILPNAMVRKVLIKDNTAVGVEFDFNGTVRQVNAKREVILSAGTTNTAQLLMLSGIGPKDELDKFNIPVVADLPVGKNFQDHPATFVTYEVNDKLPKFDSEIRQKKNIKKYIKKRRGPLTSTEGVLLMSFLSNSEDGMEGDPDYSVYIADFVNLQTLQAGLTPEIVSKVLAPSANKSVISCASQLLRTRSIGSVTIQSADPYDPPVIDPNYFADPQDFEDVVQGLKVCNQIMSHKTVTRRLGAKPLNVVIPGCEDAFNESSDAYIRCIVRTIIVTTSHQVGTARMGDPNNSTTVVDPQLRVKGVKNLRVVDASVMPTIPWSNTNIPTIMVAEKASDIIKNDSRK